jgi:aryl carrier-like protein
LLTTQAFREVAVDGLPARRLFRTGDLAVRRPDGNIQVLGRIDSQVKLRGFRIELEEIEAILRRAPTVANCAVAVRGAADDQRLVAYIVLQPGAALAGEKLSAHVAAHLPDYMVPASWVALDALPLTPNKKLDRKALPDPKPVSERPQRTIVAPSTPLETKLATIWSEVLKIDRIGIHENLFGLGADSLHIFRIAARMNEAELPLKARHLLHNPTIAQLAAVLETTASERAADANDGLPSLREFRGGARRTRRST